MSMDYASILTRFNISPAAAKVYLALLELGKSSAIGIAHKTGMYNANVYEALGKLVEAGLSTYLMENHKKLYITTNPEKLLDVAAAAERKSVESFDALKKDIERLMPTLSAKYLQTKEKNVFEVYYGKKACEAMLQDIAREKPKYWKGFGNLQIQKFFPITFKKWFKRILSAIVGFAKDVCMPVSLQRLT